MSAAARLALSPSAFLDWEAEQEERHEYHRGEVFAMAVGTETHARIITNTLIALSAALKGRGCTVYTDALRVRVEAEDLFTYPDLSVVCGPGQFYDTKRTTLLNPIVLVEVLSPSTETYDRTAKLRFYRQIPGLQAVLLVAQDGPAVDIVARAGDGWGLSTEAGGEVEVAALGVRLALGDLYDGVAFPDVPLHPGQRL
ncbi:MAG TPA: Uma2 family endonuclease [Rubricoccaceae bacterium]|jgi:Uma2 family endonuclease